MFLPVVVLAVSNVVKNSFKKKVSFLCRLYISVLARSMQFGGFSAGELSEEEVSELPSCAFANRPTSSGSNLQHHYLTSLHHNTGTHFHLTQLSHEKTF